MTSEMQVLMLISNIDLTVNTKSHLDMCAHAGCKIHEGIECNCHHALPFCLGALHQFSAYILVLLSKVSLLRYFLCAIDIFHHWFVNISYFTSIGLISHRLLDYIMRLTIWITVFLLALISCLLNIDCPKLYMLNTSSSGGIYWAPIPDIWAV
jgi:hypothetical protein